MASGVIWGPLCVVIPTTVVWRKGNELLMDAWVQIGGGTVSLESVGGWRLEWWQNAQDDVSFPLTPSHLQSNH